MNQLSNYDRDMEHQRERSESRSINPRDHHDRLAFLMSHTNRDPIRFYDESRDPLSAYSVKQTAKAMDAMLDDAERQPNPNEIVERNADDDQGATMAEHDFDGLS